MAPKISRSSAPCLLHITLLAPVVQRWLPDIYYICIKKKVKQSYYRPGQALRVSEGWGSQISRQSAHEGGKVVSPTHRPLFTPRKYSWYSFLLEAESTPRPQCGRKDYVNEKFPSGIEPATFRLVAQCLNKLRYGVPLKFVYPSKRLYKNITSVGVWYEDYVSWLTK